jgi:hypothetical protein
MLTFLNNWKLYFLSFALIGVLTLNVVQRYSLEKTENKLQICQGDVAAQKIAFDLANQLKSEQERKLRLREQEAAKARAESLKRMDEIMNVTVPKGCDNAIQFLIDNKPGFS